MLGGGLTSAAGTLAGGSAAATMGRSPTYHYDGDAMRLPIAPSSVGRLQRAMDANMGVGGCVISGGGYTPPGQNKHTGPERDARAASERANYRSNVPRTAATRWARLRRSRRGVWAPTSSAVVPYQSLIELRAVYMPDAA